MSGLHQADRFGSFRTNDLIYTLAIDRNNEHVAEMCKREPAVLRLIDYAISACRRHGSNAPSAARQFRPRMVTCLPSTEYQSR